MNSRSPTPLPLSSSLMTVCHLAGGQQQTSPMTMCVVILPHNDSLFACVWAHVFSSSFSREKQAAEPSQSHREQERTRSRILVLLLLLMVKVGLPTTRWISRMSTVLFSSWRWLVGWVNCRRTDRRTKALIRNLRVAESSSVSSLRGTTGFLLVEFPQFNIDSNQRRKIHSRVVLSWTGFA